MHMFPRFVTAVTLAILCHSGPLAAQTLQAIPCSGPTSDDGRVASTVLGIGEATGVLSPDAWERQYVGRWRVRLTIDSVQALVQHGDTTSSVFRPLAPACSASGELTITDSTAPLLRGMSLRAPHSLSYGAFYGGPLSWRDHVHLLQTDSGLVINFCPGCFDTGVVAFVRAYGDSLVGYWSERAFLGYFRAGALTLYRDHRP